jgi:hypothetical protein
MKTGPSTCRRGASIPPATWPGSLADEFRNFSESLTSARDPESLVWGQPARVPFWTELPAWVAARFGPPRSRPLKEFVNHVSWAQKLLFYGVRIHDDALDGEKISGGLIFAGDLCFLEAEDFFHSAFGNSTQFWKLYHTALRRTLTGILRVAELQRTPRSSSAALLKCYHDVNALFTIAPAAVCEKVNKLEALPPICTFVEHLATAAQILDDVEDLGEDLARGTFNFAANVVVGRGGATANQLLQSGGNERRFLTEKILLTISRAARKELALAEKSIARIDFSKAQNVIARLKTSIESLEETASGPSNGRPPVLKY